MLLLLIKPKLFAIKNSVTMRVVLRRLPFIAIGVGFWFLFISGLTKS